MSEYLHIVSFEAPAPPDYGGAIDVYYKIKALAKTGKKIILHYFDYKEGRGTTGLEDSCIAMYSYKRKSALQIHALDKPFIVSSRVNQDLIDRLNKDDYPVLLEGVHCTGIIPYLQERKTVIRLHNDEAEYYANLARSEKSIQKKLYFKIESSLLNKYQQSINKEVPIAALSTLDINRLKDKEYRNPLHFIPTFIPWQEITSIQGKGAYCLYHGNLSVSENERAAEWLITHVFSQINIPLIIAGKGASGRLYDLAKPYTHISIKPNPETSELNILIQEAHINILPSMNHTGVKLKVLNALFNGRFCLTNKAAVEGSEMEKAVYIAHEPKEFIENINRLFHQDFTGEDLASRTFLLSLYNNALNAQKLNACL